MAEKVRVQLDFSPDALRELDHLKDQTAAGSRADVVRYSLRVLQWVLEQMQNDSKIIVQKNGANQEIVFSFLKPAAAISASTQRSLAR